MAEYSKTTTYGEHTAESQYTRKSEDLSNIRIWHKYDQITSFKVTARWGAWGFIESDAYAQIFLGDKSKGDMRPDYDGYSQCRPAEAEFISKGGLNSGGKWSSDSSGAWREYTFDNITGEQANNYMVQWARWTDSAAVSRKWRFGNRSITLTWNTPELKITVNSATGVKSTSGGQAEISKNISLSVTPLEGYLFDYWSDDSNNKSNPRTYTVLDSDIKQVGVTTKSFTPVMKPKTYTITFNANGGTLPSGLSTLSPTYNSQNYYIYSALKNTSRNGYTLKGFYDAPNGGNKIYDVNGNYVSGTYWDSNGYWKYDGNVTAYAQWTPITYNIAFNGNGSTSGSMSALSATFNSDVKLTTNNFSRKYDITYDYGYGGQKNTVSVNYSFNGWEDKGSIIASDGKTYSADVFDAPYYANTYSDLYNAFKYNKYNLINHYINNGKGEGRSPVSSNGTRGTYPNGATVNSLCSTQGSTDTLYAQWKSNSVVLPTLSRSGYTFNGWYTAASGGTKIGNAGASYTPTANITLYAQWTEHILTFKYYANNGETSSFITWNAKPSQSWPNNHYDYTKPEKPETYKTRIGYTGTGNYGTTKTNEFGAVGGKVFNQDYDFQSYEDLCNKYGKNITDQKNEIPLYAEWTPNTYYIKYNGNDSTGGSIGDSTHTYDVSFNLPSSGFTRKYEVRYDANGGSCSTAQDEVSHTLSHWNTRADDSGTKYSLNQLVKNLTSTNNGTVPLYAQWTFNSVFLPTPTRPGYTFTGWYTAASGGESKGMGNASYVPYQDITLYAQWKEHKYNIKFDGNGADDGETTQMNDIPYDTSKKLNLNGFIRIGYTFLGWSDAATHTQARYGDGAEIHRLTKEDGKTITLYAIWRQNTYTITWKNSTGDGSSYTVSIKGGTRPNELNVPNATKAYEEKVDGYHYLSYHWEPEFEVVGRDITYTAVFDATKHNYFDPVTTEPQGNYMGYKTHQCKQCNWSYKDEYAWLITFKNGDYNENRQDEVIKVPPGQIPQWSQIPEKTSENTLVFSFDTDNPWAPPVAATPTTEPSDKGNILYTPQFKSSTRYYIVTFENDDGTIRDIQTLEYDQDIVPPEPLDIDDAQYDYTFEYWYAEDDESDIILYGEKGKVKRDGVVYMPHYSRIVKAYRLEWWNNAGEEPVLLYYQDNVPYGTVPEYPFKTLGIPKKESTNDSTFTFTGWDCILIDPVTGEEKEFFFDDNNPEAEEKEDLEPIRWPTKYIAHFRDDTRYYKIKWLNPSENPNKEWDLFYEEEIQYGDVPEFDITKSETLKELKHPLQGKDKIFNYIFIGWKTSINDEPIEGELPFQGEITYMAVYIKKYIEYSIKIYRFYGDDYLRDKENNPKPEEYIRHYGDKLYPNALLNDIIGHDFSHWSNNQNGTNELTKNEVLSIVVEDTAEYWAIYNKKEYQVRWLDYNRVQIGDYKTFKYKDNPLNPEPPEQKPQEPTRGHDDLYHYTFRTWSIWSGRATSDGRILGNVSYIANYDKHEHSWEETTYEFTDYGKKCIASRICNFKHNGHIEEHTQSKEVKTTPIILNGDDATCTDMGYTTYVANFRDSWNITNPQQSIRIKDIPAKGHDYAPADSLGKNIEKGEHYIYCRRCDYSRIEPHNWQPIQDAEITSYAACLIGGKRKYRCQTFGCEGYYYEHIEPNGHNFTDDRRVKAVEETCTKSGNVAYKQCDDCLLFFPDNAGERAYGEKTNKSFLIPPLGHDYILNEKRPIIKADCETAGAEYRTCSRNCGEEGADITIIIPPRGHDWAWQSTTTPATCTQEGKEMHYCQNTRSDRVTDLYKQCEVQPKEVTVPKTPHQPVTIYGYEPTCTKDGLSDGTKCKICNTELTLQYTLPALGHKCVAKNVVPAENTLRREIIYGCVRKDCKYDYHIEYIK